MNDAEIIEAVARAIGDVARSRHGGTLMAWAVSPERKDCVAFARAAITAYHAALHAAGYTIVPRETTHAMQQGDIRP